MDTPRLGRFLFAQYTGAWLYLDEGQCEFALFLITKNKKTLQNFK
jgi:hypothetical protein